MKLQAIHRLCRRLLMIMQNCWRVNESWIVDITEFLIQKLSAAFGTKCLSVFSGDECDNFNCMNFKIDSSKIRKNSWILGNFKIRKILILNPWLLLRKRLCSLLWILCAWSKRNNEAWWRLDDPATAASVAHDSTQQTVCSVTKHSITEKSAQRDANTVRWL